MPRPLQKLIDYKKPLLVSHRGYGKMGKHPENTWPAFEKSTQLGFLAHELDVRKTKDNVVVLFHGPKLEKVSDGYGKIEKLHFKEIKNLNFAHYLKNYPKTPPTTLEEYFQKIPKNVITNIEIKRDFWDFSRGIEEAVIELIYKYQKQRRVFISSFHWFSLYRLRKLAPNLARGLLLDNGRFFFIREFLGKLIAKPDLIHPHYSLLTLNRIQKYKRQGYGLAVWTVNNPNLIKEFFEKGVDFVITDNIDLIQS